MFSTPKVSSSLNNSQERYEAKLKPGDLFRMTYFLGYEVQKQKIGISKKTTHYYKELKCTGCDRIFRTRFGLQRHIQSLHPGLNQRSRATIARPKAYTASPKISPIQRRQLPKRNAVTKKPAKPWEDDSDSEIEILSDSSVDEVKSRVTSSPRKRRSPKKLTNRSSTEEIFEDTENATSFDVATAECLALLEEFNPKVVIKDIYKYPEQTSISPPPKELYISKESKSISEPIVIGSPEKEVQALEDSKEDEIEISEPIVIGSPEKEVQTLEVEDSKEDDIKDVSDPLSLVDVVLSDEPGDSENDEPEEIQCQESIRKSDFMKRMRSRSQSDSDQSQPKKSNSKDLGQQLARGQKVSRKEAIKEILKDSPPKIEEIKDKLKGTSTTLVNLSDDSDDIICID